LSLKTKVGGLSVV
jgi:hypothetical protein